MTTPSTFLKSDFLSRHETDIWTQFLAQALPLDRFLADYYRAHRYLGAKDRRHLSTAIYTHCRQLPWPAALAPYYRPSYDLEAPLVIRANRLKITRDDLMQRLAQEGVESTPTQICPDGVTLSRRMDLQQNAAFKAGLFEVQDEGSQLVGDLMDPASDMLILDACAGAGGKTLQLAARLQNQGTVIATDKDPRRLRELHQRQVRAGARGIQIYELHDPHLKSFHNRCDQVLIDAPCSGTGTIRRNPDLKIRFQPDQLADYTAMQREVLDTFSPFVRPGGSLYYVTCSFLTEENEEMIQWFRKHQPDFSLAPRHHSPALSPAILNAIQTPDGAIRTHRLDHPWDSFFIAEMRRA